MYVYVFTWVLYQFKIQKTLQNYYVLMGITRVYMGIGELNDMGLVIWCNFTLFSEYIIRLNGDVSKWWLLMLYPSAMNLLYNIFAGC